MDGGDSDAERHDVFIGTVLTLQRIDCAQQTFMVTGYVNAMWHCSDLEKEVSRQDYYGPENSLTVKDGLQLARKQKAGEQLKGEDEKRAVPGYIRSSVADDKETIRKRHFVTGFTLSHESDVLPFNPSKMFEDRRIVPETFEREEETYYYYPEDENEGKKCAGMIKMAIKFHVTLTQRLDMKRYPFDRQILNFTLLVRGHRWKVTDPEDCDWLDTGYKLDKELCTTHLSETLEAVYTLKKPWIEDREEQKKKNPKHHTVYFRVERQYEYELRKIFYPLFIIVLMAMASLGLEPDKTDGMMLATIGFQYVIQTEMPKVATRTRMDDYVNLCMLLILLVVAETLFAKQWLEGSRFSEASLTPEPEPEPEPEPASRNTMLGESTAAINRGSREYVQMEWLDTVSVGIALLAWVLPHMVLFLGTWLYYDKTKQMVQSSWDDVVQFHDKACNEKVEESTLKAGDRKRDKIDEEDIDAKGRLKATPTKHLSRYGHALHKRPSPVRPRSEEGGLQRTRTVPANLPSNSRLVERGTAVNQDRAAAPGDHHGAGQQRPPLRSSQSHTLNATVTVDEELAQLFPPPEAVSQQAP